MAPAQCEICSFHPLNNKNIYLTRCLQNGNFLYGFSAGKLNELLLVTKEAFFNNLAEDSDICKSFITDFGGFFDLALLISGVTPFVILCKQNYMKDET